jgi:DUF971 family protein
MSHEGIRFVAPEESERARLKERELPRDAVEPLKVKVHQTEGTGVDIAWKDGHHSSWTFAWLRAACPCATCVDEREGAGLNPGETKAAPGGLLPMFKAPPRPTEVTPVGHYAVRFSWNDGHASGIYSWDYLRRVCQCSECTGQVSSEVRATK